MSGHFLNISLPFKKGASLYLKIPFSIQPRNKDEIGNSNTSVSCGVSVSPHNTGLPHHQKWGKSLSPTTVSSVNTEAREVISSSQLPAGIWARTEAPPGQIYPGRPSHPGILLPEVSTPICAVYITIFNRNNYNSIVLFKLLLNLRRPFKYFHIL